MTLLQQLDWDHIGLAIHLLRIIREVEQCPLTPEQRDDLAHATATAHRVSGVALGDPVLRLSKLIRHAVASPFAR